MSGKGSTFANAYLKLLFQGTAIANIADNAASGPLTDLYLSLHTADPGPSGDQTTHECVYTSYARVAVVRTSSGFTVTGNVLSLVADAVFPTPTGGSEIATFYVIGTLSTGAGILLYSGPLSPSISISSGATAPKIKSTSTLTEN